MSPVIASDAELRIPVTRSLKAALIALAFVIVCAGGILAVSLNPSNKNSADASQLDDPDLSQWTREESAAADKEMWDQLSSGWVVYGSYEADTQNPVRGWIHLRATPDSVDYDLVRSQNENNFGGLPIYDAPDGKQIGVHFSMVGFVSLSSAPAFDSTAARLRNFGCDPLASDHADGRRCMDRLIADSAKQADIAQSSAAD